MWYNILMDVDIIDWCVTYDKTLTYVSCQSIATIPVYISLLTKIVEEVIDLLMKALWFSS